MNSAIPIHIQVHHYLLHLCSKARLPNGHSFDQRVESANMQQAKTKPCSPQRPRCCSPLSPDTAGFGEASGPPMGTQEGFAGGKQLAEPCQQPQAGLQLSTKAVTAFKTSSWAPQLFCWGCPFPQRTGGASYASLQRAW